MKSYLRDTFEGCSNKYLLLQILAMEDIFVASLARATVTSVTMEV